ncbi:MAG: MBL fold metallo-hydrolase [Dehalococcoidia bacterium]|nr:MBL fold metallo-hydrolase [Dehalococcoidia bacterium]
METVRDGDLEIRMAGPAGAYANNLYLVIDRATGEAAFIDAPDEPEKSIALAREAGVRPAHILLTHSHMDHTAGLDHLRRHFNCTLHADAREPWLKEGQIDAAVAHGDEIKIGNLIFRVLSVPGHTPGSTTYVCGQHAFVGDTLFPGGPGRSSSNEALRQEIASIETHLYALPDETHVYPGHGNRTTIGASKAESAAFRARPLPAGLSGDVTWG